MFLNCSHLKFTFQKKRPIPQLHPYFTALLPMLPINNQSIRARIKAQTLRSIAAHRASNRKNIFGKTALFLRSNLSPAPCSSPVTTRCRAIIDTHKHADKTARTKHSTQNGRRLRSISIFPRRVQKVYTRGETTSPAGNLISQAARVQSIKIHDSVCARSLHPRTRKANAHASVQHIYSRNCARVLYTRNLRRYVDTYSLTH